MCPIGSWRGVRVGRLGVPLDAWHASVQSPFPQYLTGVLAETVEFPDMNGVILDRGNVTIEANPQTGIRHTTDRGHHVNRIATNNRAGVPQTRDLGPWSRVGGPWRGITVPGPVSLVPGQ